MGGRTLDQFNSRQLARAKNAKHDKESAADNPRTDKEKARTPLSPK